MKLLTAVLCVLCAPALATPSGFALRPPYASGAAVIASPTGGEYVYAAPAIDTRVPSSPILITPPERQHYTFFSAEEEQALLRYRDQQLAHRNKQEATIVRKRPHPLIGKLNWPKVIVRADTVCVPELASSEAADWRAHLVCSVDGGVR